MAAVSCRVPQTCNGVSISIHMAAVSCRVPQTCNGVSIHSTWRLCHAVSLRQATVDQIQRLTSCIHVQVSIIWNATCTKWQLRCSLCFHEFQCTPLTACRRMLLLLTHVRMWFLLLLHSGLVSGLVLLLWLLLVDDPQTSNLACILHGVKVR